MHSQEQTSYNTNSMSWTQDRDPRVEYHTAFRPTCVQPIRYKWRQGTEMGSVEKEEWVGVRDEGIRVEKEMACLRS